ncbi:MAG: hypothetical protein ACI4MG_08150 [Aristaeellaceae bacterium]
MAKKEPAHPLYAVFMALMILILLTGLFLMIYGSMNNGIPVPPRPGNPSWALAERLIHG